MLKYLITFVCLTCLVYSDELLEDEVQQTSVDAPVSEPGAEKIIQPIGVPQAPSVAPPSVTEKKRKSAFTAVSLSYLYPGLGHAYLNEYVKAGSIGGTFGLGVGLFPPDQQNPQIESLAVLQNTWFYGVYSAYRDVRLYNNNAGYKYQMPVESFRELATAPFRYSVMKKPEVWGGVLGFLTLATGMTYVTMPKDSTATQKVEENVAAKDLSKVNPLVAFPVGLGEEVFFRGYLLPMLSEMSNPTWGIVSSSLLFGAMHIPNARLLPESERNRYYTVSIPYITALGAYFGWLSQRTNSLQECVAMHSWYDFTLFSLGALAQKAVIGKPTRVAFSFAF